MGMDMISVVDMSGNVSAVVGAEVNMGVETGSMVAGSSAGVNVTVEVEIHPVAAEAGLMVVGTGASVEVVAVVEICAGMGTEMVMAAGAALNMGLTTMNSTKPITSSFPQ